MSGLGIAAPDTVTRTRALLDRLASDDDVDVVTTAHDTSADLIPGRSALARLDELLQTHVDEFRNAQQGHAGRRTTFPKRSPRSTPNCATFSRPVTSPITPRGSWPSGAGSLTPATPPLQMWPLGCRPASRSSAPGCVSGSSTTRRHSQGLFDLERARKVLDGEIVEDELDLLVYDEDELVLDEHGRRVDVRYHLE